MTTTSAAPRRVAVRGHLDQVDLFRVLTFCSVVAVHTTAFGNSANSVGAGAASILLHFTREAFFFLTGFVLVFSQGTKPLRPVTFWRRRFRLIGIPYLTWTLIYFCYTQATSVTATNWPHTLLVDVISGNAYYHLYFLVVSMQAYLLFPVLLWVLRMTRNHSWMLLAGAAAIELAEMLWSYRATPPTTGPLHFYAAWSYVIFASYLLYLVAGAVVARHLAQCQDWLMAHRPLAVAFGLTSAAVALAWFFLEVHRGFRPDAGSRDASAVFQPVMVLWSLGSIALLAVISCSWASGRALKGNFHKGLMWASSASFGVYLVHPLVLAQVFRLDLQTRLPQPLATILIWVMTLLISAAVVAVFRRTPLSLALTGRSRPARALVAPVIPTQQLPGGERVPAHAV